jgi:hypothetical protein
MVLDNMDDAIPSGHHWSTGGNLKKHLLLSSVPVFLVCQDLRCTRMKAFARENVHTIFVRKPSVNRLHEAMIAWFRMRWGRKDDCTPREKKAFYHMVCEAKCDVRRAQLMLDVYKPHSSFDENVVLLQSLFNPKRSAKSLLEGLERQTTSDLMFTQLLMFRNYVDVYTMPPIFKKQSYAKRLEDLANTADNFSLSDTFHVGDDVGATMQLMPYKAVLSLVKPARDTHYAWNARKYVRANGLSTDPSASHAFGKQLKCWSGEGLRGYDRNAKVLDVLPALRFISRHVADLKQFAKKCANELGLNDSDLMKALVVAPQKALKSGGNLTSAQQRTLTTTLNAYNREHLQLIRAPKTKAPVRRKRKRDA